MCIYIHIYVMYTYTRIKLQPIPEASTWASFTRRAPSATRAINTSE